MREGYEACDVCGEKYSYPGTSCPKCDEALRLVPEEVKWMILRLAERIKKIEGRAP